MTTYMITYSISDSCGCGHAHDNEHTDVHHHNHNSENNHHHDDNCNCNNNHKHIESSENRIIRKIKSLGPWAHFMPEGYLIKSESLSAEEILKELEEVSNKGDILFVTKVDATSCACQNPAVIDWTQN